MTYSYAGSEEPPSTGPPSTAGVPYGPGGPFALLGPHRVGLLTAPPPVVHGQLTLPMPHRAGLIMPVPIQGQLVGASVQGQLAAPLPSASAGPYVGAFGGVGVWLRWCSVHDCDSGGQVLVYGPGPISGVPAGFNVIRMGNNNGCFNGNSWGIWMDGHP